MTVGYPPPPSGAAASGWTSSSRRLLLAVLLLALAHALAEARLRPLYQVSDEMAYLGSAQDVALAAVPDRARCIAPPDGSRLASGGGGKAGFRAVAGWQLARLCDAGAEHLPLFWLRALQALSFPVVALCAGLLARQLSGRDDAAVLAALIVAVHPVAAKYAGGVTPDAWANAFAAGAFLSATQLASARWRWHTPWLLGACTFGGMLWKDTATMLAPLAAIAIVLAIVRGTRHRAGTTRGRRLAVATSLAAVVAATGMLASTFSRELRSDYLDAIPEANRALLLAPLSFGSAVADDVGANLVGILTSSVVSLYRPLVYAGLALDVTSAPATPPVALLVTVAFFVIGGVGVVVWLVSGSDRGPACRVGVLAMWALAAGACLAQPSVRQVLFGTFDSHQGRWLFPVLAPAAALAGTGLSHLGRRRQLLPGIVLAGVASVWLVVLDVVRHYYLALPDRLNVSVLFVRPTGDHDIGDLQVRRLVEATTTAQDPATIWGILVVLVVASLAVAVSAIRDARAPAPHV